MQFPFYQQLRERQKHQQRSLINQTRFYFKSDIQSTAKYVQRGKVNIQVLYGKLAKLRYDNLLRAYDQGYRNLFKDGIEHMTATEAYACYRQYPEQYQKINNYLAHNDTTDHRMTTIAHDSFLDEYNRTLRETNYLYHRTTLAKRIRNLFGKKSIHSEFPANDSISDYILFEPDAFYHVSKASLQAKLAHRLSGIVKYRFYNQTVLPINSARKKKVKVTIIDGLGTHPSYPKADITVVFT